MDLSTFIIAVFCLIDEIDSRTSGVSEHAVPFPYSLTRKCSPSRSSVSFWGIDEDTELFAYFRRHYAHFL
jgi:hypothetical protein